MYRRKQRISPAYCEEVKQTGRCHVTSKGGHLDSKSGEHRDDYLRKTTHRVDVYLVQRRQCWLAEPAIC